jgi:hypothetical protein
MLLNYIQHRQKMLKESNNFYTPSGIHVFTKDQMLNNLVDLDSVIANLESKLPDHIRDGVEMIIIGHFNEFDERGINAFYKDGALYVSNIQDDSEDLLDDLVHETAHSVEEQYGMEIYADQEIKDEFLRKRVHLYNVLWNMGFEPSREMFLDIEYVQDFDEYLLQDIGYDKLSGMLKGIMISPYAATSLREYFATGFTEFYLYPDSHGHLQKMSPELYKKLVQLHKIGDA